MKSQTPHTHTLMCGDICCREETIIGCQEMIKYAALGWILTCFLNVRQNHVVAINWKAKKWLTALSPRKICQPALFSFSFSLLCERSFVDAGSLPLLSGNICIAEYVNNMAARNILLLRIFHGQSCVEDSHCVSLNKFAHNLPSGFKFSEKATSRPKCIFEKCQMVLRCRQKFPTRVGAHKKIIQRSGPDGD